MGSVRRSWLELKDERRGNNRCGACGYDSGSLRKFGRTQRNSS